MQVVYMATRFFLVSASVRISRQATQSSKASWIRYTCLTGSLSCCSVSHLWTSKPKAGLMTYIGQLSGIALALSISGATFVNTALHSLQKLLPNVPRQQLQAAISGTSGDFFATLDPATTSAALEIIMSSLQKV